MPGAGRNLRAELTPFSSLRSAKPYGASHGANAAVSRKIAADHQPGHEHPALPADALLELVDDGQPGPEAALGDGVRLPCQYLTLGSMSAATMSTMKLVTATITASSTTMPCTATKSRAVRYCTS